MSQTKIKVATYNVGDYTGRDIKHGSSESRKVFREVFAKVGADLWGLQEDVKCFNNETGETAFNAVYSSVLPNYARNYSGNYNGKAFLTRFELSDVQAIQYTGDLKYRHPWFLTGKIAVDGKGITLICLHFDWSDKAVRAEQITQLLEFAEQQKYCIIMGDFNPEDYVDDGKRLSNQLFYKEEFGRFEAAGFSAANGGEFGYFDTILDSQSSPCPFDNILVSSNMKIVAADRVAEPWMNDHALLFAEIMIE